jgi:AraC-like DNA-binding protein
VARQNADAVAWFAEHGYQVTARDLQLFADEITAPEFRIARTWHTSGHLESLRPRGTALLLIQIEGTTRIRFTRTNGADVALVAGDLAYLPAGDTLTLSSDAPTARIEVETTGIALPPLVASSLSEGAVFHGPPPSARAVLVEVVNTVLNSTMHPNDHGFPAFRLALRHHVASLLLDATPTAADPARSDREAVLYQLARDAISRRAFDPAFSVTALALELRISAPYLRRIFASHGSTARAEIRSARAAMARSHLQSDSARYPITVTDAARLSGFRDVATMRAALRDHPDA